MPPPDVPEREEAPDLADEPFRADDFFVLERAADFDLADLPRPADFRALPRALPFDFEALFDFFAMTFLRVALVKF